MTHPSQQQSGRPMQSRRWLIDDFAAPARPPGNKLAMPTRPLHPRVSQAAAADTALRRVAPAIEVAAEPRPQPVRQVAEHKVEETLVQHAAPAPRKRFFKQPVFVVLAVVIFAAGMGVTWWGYKVNSAVQAQVTSLSSADTDEVPPATDEPSEQEVGGYVVAANMPRYLTIDKLGINARIRTMGTTKTGAVQAPTNVHDVGWYSGSSLPGVLGGAAFMDGHVSSWDTDGVFKHLPKLAVGDEIKVEMGDGRILVYRVVKTEASPADSVDMSKALVPVTAGKGGLNLMTCYGKVKPGTDEFTDRFMVYAEQI